LASRALDSGGLVTYVAQQCGEPPSEAGSGFGGASGVFCHGFSPI
jgi:hypothetical protein